jgi:hypothetical protein
MKQSYKELTYWNKSVRDKVAIACCLGMVAGLFFSRALLSMSMFAMLINALHPGYIRESWLAWKKSSFAWLSLAFFCIYLLSGLWSGNKEFWLASTINKVPFAILPFAFMSAPLQREQNQRIIIVGVALMQIAVIGYSLVEFGLHTEYYLQGYHISRPLPTTKYDDHIRFSLSLVISILMNCFILFERRGMPASRWLKLFSIGCIILFVIYIHILAAKTGLLCLYLVAIVYILSKIYRRHKTGALLLALGVASVPAAAYYLIPTFKTKIDYVFYEIDRSRAQKRYDYTLSDAGRMITYELGAKAIRQHPAAGVGAGDVMDAMRQGYARDYPEVAADQQYGPINQFMFTALCTGIPLCLFLVALALCPFFIAVRYRVYLVATGMVMLISMMVEAMLELQFGVFTYLFFLLFWIASLKKDNASAQG